MSTRIDIKITQSENLNKLLEINGVSKEKQSNIESVSIVPEDKTVNEKPYNTKLVINLTPIDGVARPPVSTSYNRVRVGWVGDDEYAFTYDNALGTPLKKDGSEDDLGILTKLVNASTFFSQDEKYPFRVKVNPEYTRIEVIPHLDSPCYIGGKEYGLKILTDPRSIKIFEPETYVVSAMAVPHAQWTNGSKDTTVSLELQDEEGQTKTVKAMVMPYREEIDGTMYKMNLGLDFPTKSHLLYTDTTRPVLKNSYESLLPISKPLEGELTEERLESLKLLYKDMEDDNSILTYANAKLSGGYVSDNNVISINKGVHDYRLNILKAKCRDIYYHLINDISEGDPIKYVKETNSYIMTMDETYRTHYPEEKICFKLHVDSPDNELGIEFTNITDYTNVNGPRTARNIFGDFDRFNQFMRILRNHALEKLKARGVSIADASIILQSARNVNVWQTITERFTTFHNGNPNIRKNSLFIDYDITFVAKKGMPIRLVSLLGKDTYNTPEKKERLLTDVTYFDSLVKAYLVKEGLLDVEDDIPYIEDNTINKVEKVSTNIVNPVRPENTTSKQLEYRVDRYSNRVFMVGIPRGEYTEYIVIQYEMIPSYTFLSGSRVFADVNRETYSIDALLNADIDEFTNLMKRYAPDFPYKYLDLEKTQESIRYLTEDKSYGIGITYFVKENVLFSNSGNSAYTLITLRYA